MLGNKKLLEALDIITLAGEIDGSRRRLGLLGGWRRHTGVRVPSLAANFLAHSGILNHYEPIRIVVVGRDRPVWRGSNLNLCQLLSIFSIRATD
jgi:hypothetical protein